jgi:hypothetical protein
MCGKFPCLLGERMNVTAFTIIIGGGIFHGCLAGNKENDACNKTSQQNHYPPSS